MSGIKHRRMTRREIAAAIPAIRAPFRDVTARKHLAGLGF
jgi:hypothetical protein